MSIIADTLKRLQTQSEGTSPESMDAPSSRPAFNKGEGSGRHRKDSPFGFLMVMVGMTLTLGALAFAAFWMGGHLDFGLATDTQARMNAHRSIPNSPDPSEDPVVAVAPEPIQFPPSPSTPPNNEQHQTSANLGTASVPFPPAPHHEGTTPSLFEGETNDPSSTKAMVSKASQDQQRLSRTIVQSSGVRETSMIPPLSVSEEPSSVIISTERPTLTTEYPATDDVLTDQTDKLEAQNLVPMSLEEEIIQTQELVKNSGSSTDSTHRATALAGLKTRQESTNHDVPATVPLPLTPANQLRQAQELIQTGNYEEAVALLSPLFHDPPVKWQPWFWMGTALLGKGDMEQADQFLLSGLARNDKIPQLWIQRALVAQQRGDYQLAIHELRQAESLEADLPHIHLNMGYAYEQLGNDRLANQYYGKFMKLAEGNPVFFSTRKKLFARLTQQVHATKPLPPLPSSIPDP